MSSPFVFSIRPEYVARIFEGSKRVEYRTRCPNIDPYETILIYETAPVSRIVGSATARKLCPRTPEAMWVRTSHVGGVGFDAFAAYFHGRSVAYAMELTDVVKFSEPQELPAGMKAPQSWARYKGVWS